jgi:hypothetical protein
VGTLLWFSQPLSANSCVNNVGETRQIRGLKSVSEKTGKALVPSKGRNLELLGSGARHILDVVVSDTLSLARQNSSGSSEARHKVGGYELCDKDYQQVLIWAEDLDQTPIETLKILETALTLEVMESYQDYHDEVEFQIQDRSILSLVWVDGGLLLRCSQHQANLVNAFNVVAEIARPHLRL